MPFSAMEAVEAMLTALNNTQPIFLHSYWEGVSCWTWLINAIDC